MRNQRAPLPRTARHFAWWAVLVLSLALPIAAKAAPAPGVSVQDLRAFGVKNLDEFHAVFTNRDGRIAYFWEPFERAQRADGNMAALWEFRFRADGSLSEQRHWPLPIPRPNQVALTPDEKGAVIMAREGSSFWHLDFASGKLNEFVQPGLGKTRFISEPRVMWTEQGKLWTVGNPLSKDGVKGPETMAVLNPYAKGDDALQISDVNLDEALRLLKRWKMQRFVSPTTGFMAGLLDGKLKACFWKAGVGLTPYAEFRDITSAWTTGDWEIMVGIVPDGKSQGFIHDGQGNKTWTLPAVDAKEPYDYPFISEGGEVITVVTGARDGRMMTVHYGRKADNFQLKPVPGMTKVPVGMLRLSQDGSRLVYRNSTGIVLVEVPR